MSTKEKLIKRIKTRPKNFTYDELETLLIQLDYRISNKGKTSGSRVMFISDIHPVICLHKPHPRKEVSVADIKKIVELLEKENLI